MGAVYLFERSGAGWQQTAYVKPLVPLGGAIPYPPRTSDYHYEAELVIAIVPAENASGVTDRYQPFVEYLGRELGTKVVLRIASDYAAGGAGIQLDNLKVTGTLASAVPEPATWAMIRNCDGSVSWVCPAW